MATLAPTEALFACENALRELMAYAYRATYGEGWLSRVTTEPQRAKWAARAEKERSRLQKGVVDVPASGLGYSEFYELVEIAHRDWAPLAAALGKRERTHPLLKRFEELRNTVAHVRQLYAFEEDIYSGIAGTIRNQVTIYMSTQDPAGDYYPRIEAAWDSFGNRIDGDVQPGSAGEIAGRINSDLILRPGELVAFTCVGIDPHERDLEWDFQPPSYADQQRLQVGSGRQVTFTWTVNDADVGEHAVVNFYMRCSGSSYNRANGFDQRIYFSYMVRPPLPSP